MCLYHFHAYTCGHMRQIGTNYCKNYRYYPDPPCTGRQRMMVPKDRKCLPCERFDHRAEMAEELARFKRMNGIAEDEY